MKRKIILTALAAMFLTGCGGQQVITVADISSEEGQEPGYIEMQEFELKEDSGEAAGDKSGYCVVMIPEGFEKSDEIPGMYVHERSPLDSSNVYYTVSEGIGDGMVSSSLTEEDYIESIEEAYKESGQDVDLQVESFEKIDMEGIPGYKIRSNYNMDGETIEQVAYMILADNTYTVTYSQMAGDELLADFELSDGLIRLVREEETGLVKNQ
ncbi:MAG: hypothetical protein K2P30_04045 [Lachnospiraceae bacterium]|nr:hypothetical protein [Lachnospiraceae bacterium]